MRIEWIGHACFFITSETGISIVTDPYETGFQDIMSYNPVNIRADIVTVSHEHGDHNHVQAVSGNPQVVRGTGLQTIKGQQFKGIHSFHDAVEGAQRGPNTIFTFMVDGIKTAHLGDLGHPLQPETLTELEGIDVLLAPTGGPGATMELLEVMDLWEQLKPSIVIPMHFKTEKCSFPKYGSDDLIKFSPSAQKTGSSTITVFKDELPPSTDILILDYSR